MEVSRGTQQRLVQRQSFELPVAEGVVDEMSIDGGKVRVRTSKGESCRWQDYKAVNLHEHYQAAFFQSNERLLEWVNEQVLAEPLTCLGDGHDGIWKLFSAIAKDSQRREILDWFHLKENLYKVDATEQELSRVEALLWQGKVNDALEQLKHWTDEQAAKFIGYLINHQSRIVNYGYFQAEGISIGSGTIESTVKQIAAHIKLTGAQWKSDNVSRVLLHRCAYLNGQFST